MERKEMEALDDMDGVDYEIKAQRLELEELNRITASVFNMSSDESFTVGNDPPFPA